MLTLMVGVVALPAVWTASSRTPPVSGLSSPEALDAKRLPPVSKATSSASAERESAERESAGASSGRAASSKAPERIRTRSS